MTIVRVTPKRVRSCTRALKLALSKMELRSFTAMGSTPLNSVRQRRDWQGASRGHCRRAGVLRKALTREVSVTRDMSGFLRNSHGGLGRVYLLQDISSDLARRRRLLRTRC